MSQTSGTGSGGSVAPGWYTDPQDPRQLRWWSGEGWTEHVSVGNAQAQAGSGQATQQGEALAASEAAEAAVRAQQAQQAQALAQQQAAAEAQARAQAEAQAQAAAQAQAEAEARAQAEAQAQQALLAQQRAQQALLEQQQAQQPPTADYGGPTAYQQPVAHPTQMSAPSAPTPTLPVQSRSFLEQAGYTPLDTPAAGEVPSAPPQPAGQPGAWPQSQTSAPQPAAAEYPTQTSTPAPVSAPRTAPAVPAQSSGPVQPLQASAWDQAAQEIAPFSDLTPQQNQWNQPQTPTPGLPPVPEQSWGTPATTTPAAGQDGLNALFGNPAVTPQPAAPVAEPAADTPAGQWSLAPTGQDEQVSRRRGADSAPQTAGSSTVWVWLIAISPIIAAGAIGYVLASTGYVVNSWMFEAAVAAPYLLVLLFALADRAGLQTLGHSEPRSPGWALLTAPVYLIMRAAETRREDGTGTLFTLVWFVSFLLAIGGFVGYGFLTGHPLITGLPG